jgi:hypothetical protein
MPHHPPASPASPASPAAKTWGAETGAPMVNSPPRILAPNGALIGQTLSVAPGSWGGLQPITFTYQWLRDGASIGGATAASYTLAAADLNTTVTVGEIAQNLTGANGALSANSVTPPR